MFPWADLKLPLPLPSFGLHYQVYKVIFPIQDHFNFFQEDDYISQIISRVDLSRKAGGAKNHFQ